MKKPTTIKEMLNGKLEDKFLELVPRAYDTIGDIAIIEVPEELASQERIIGEAILELHKNIKTVLKKAGIHSGTFRTQKLKLVAGEDRKETVHKENGVILKLDVEEVYFSPRTASERMRIASLVKPGEEVLVMFSGCAPLPCVLSKNSKAGYIYGIELNPIAHKYAMENAAANKAENVFLINADAKEAAPHFYKHIIGLKTIVKADQLESRIKHNPTLVELHTFKEDFEKGYDKLRAVVVKLMKEGKHVFVHQPIRTKPELDLVRSDSSNPIYSKMLELVKDTKVKLILHIFNEDIPQKPEADKIKKHILSFSKFYRYVYFENPHKFIFNTPEKIVKLAKETGMQNICIDTCHFLHIYEQSELPKIIKKIQKNYNTYFHLADYKNKIHAGKLDDSSRIKLAPILPLITKGIVEVISKDESIGKEMIDSWNYLDNFHKQFDRLLMPLPKSAADFLDVAIPAVKKNGTLHFYDFLEEGSFHIAEDKVKDACKRHKRKCKIIDTVKCGQFGPRIYRVCVDAKII